MWPENIFPGRVFQTEIKQNTSDCSVFKFLRLGVSRKHLMRFQSETVFRVVDGVLIFVVRLQHREDGVILSGLDKYFVVLVAIGWRLGDLSHVAKTGWFQLLLGLFKRWNDTKSCLITALVFILNRRLKTELLKQSTVPVCASEMLRLNFWIFSILNHPYCFMVYHYLFGVFPSLQTTILSFFFPISR